MVGSASGESVSALNGVATPLARPTSRRHAVKRIVGRKDRNPLDGIKETGGAAGAAPPVGSVESSGGGAPPPPLGGIGLSLYRDRDRYRDRGRGRPDDRRLVSRA